MTGADRRAGVPVHPPGRRWGLAVVMLAASLASTPALAQDAKVEVMSEVVLASNKGEVLDPPELAKVKEKFAQSGIRFSSYRRLSKQKLALNQKVPQSLSLPNGQKATLRLEEVKDGAASVQVHIEGPRAVRTVIQLGREGSVYQDAGSHEGGKLILVLSPPSAAP